MNKSNILLGFVTVGCILILIISWLIWNAKIEEAGGTNAATEVVDEVKEDVKHINEEAEVVNPSLLLETDFSALTSNLNESIQTLMLKRYKAEEKIDVLIIGSPAFKDSANSFAASLTEAYEGQVLADVHTFDSTSQEFVNEYMTEDIDWSKEYDLVLLEPFTLLNNGEVIIEDEHEHIDTIKAQAISVVSDAEVILTPPQPIYGAGYYLTQVTALKDFATLNNYMYIDHWTNWPATNDESLLEFIDDELTPTEKGISAWSTSLLQTFVAK